ncbi:MAG: beta strand repeat-containing protein [Terriglobales bacterium]
MTACGGGGISNNSSTGVGSHAAAAILQSIQIAANNPPFAAGLSQQLTATGSYSDGTTKDLTNSAAWSSSSSAIATVSTSGVVKAFSPGPCVITATQAGISGKLSLTVAAPVLTSIIVNSVAPSVAAGLSDQFMATGNYTDGSTQNLTGSVAWSVSNPAVASISNSGLASSKVAGSAVITATQGTITGTSSLTVGPPSLVSLAVRSASPSVGVGFTDQFMATGSYTDGSTQDLSNSVTWSVSNSALVTIANNGLVAAKSNGSVTVTASSGPITGSAALTVTISLVSIGITPPSLTIAANTDQQFRAIGTFTDSSTQDITGTVNWSSSDTTKATISNSVPTSGLAQALHAGSSVITASLGTISASAPLTISNGTLVSIAVSPITSTIPLGITQQFTATGTFSDSSTQDISNTVVWSSSEPTFVSITVSGIATGLNLTQNLPPKAAPIAITATSGSVSGSTTSITVNAADLTSLSIQGSLTVAQGTTSKLTAIGLFNDGSTRDVSAQAAWSSSNTAAATIQTNGKLQAVSQGLATITATLGSQTVSANVNVTNATVISISVTPSISSIAPLTQVTFAATGQFSDSSTQVISGNVNWATSDNTVGTVSNTAGSKGIAVGVGSGSAAITATFEGVSGSAQLNVSGANLTGIVINPPSAILAIASTQQYVATAAYDDGTSQNVSTLVTWSSSSTSTATITPFGQATGQSQGAATITASLGGFAASSTLLVESSGALTSITITPSSSTIPQQIMTGFTAIGWFANGSQDLTSAVTWTSSNASAATVSNAAGTRGYATGIAPGTSTISAIFAGVVATTSLNVTNATLVGMNITPGNPNISVGNNQSFVVTGTFSDNSTVDLSTQAIWTSQTVGVAVINSNGVATGISSGTTTITATLNGVSATAILTVN